MNMLKTTVLAAGMLLAAIQAVKADETLFPLAEGNSWDYRSNGQTLKVRVVKAQGGVFILETTCQGKTVGREFLRMDRDGLKVLKTENAEGAIEYEDPVVRIKFPAREGRRWERTFEMEGQKIVTVSRIEGAETVEVAAGTFEAVVVLSEIRGSGWSMTVQAWYAPKVGMVKCIIVTTANGKEQSSEMELSKYGVKSPKSTRTDMIEACPECGAKVEGSGKFCGECGAPRKGEKKSPRKESKKDDIDAMFEEANRLLHGKKFAEAEEIYTKILEINAKLDGVFLNRAVARACQGNYEGALEDINEAIRLVPKHGYYRMYRGMLYYDMGEDAKALADLKKAVKLDPKLKDQVDSLIEKIEERNNG